MEGGKGYREKKPGLNILEYIVIRNTKNIEEITDI